MVDTPCAAPMKLSQPHAFNRTDSGIVIIRILGEQFRPNILHTVPVVFQMQQCCDHFRLEVGGIIMRVKSLRETFGTFLTIEEPRQTLHYFQPCILHVWSGVR